MAKVNLSRYLKSLRGKVGDLVYRLMPDGSTVVSILPMINAYNLALKDTSHPPVIHRVIRKDW